MYNILLVEDSAEIQTLVLRALGSDYTVAVVSSVSEATTFLQNSKNKCDLILMDIMLPDGDGFKLSANIQNGSFGKDNENMSLVFLTAKSDISEKVLGFSLGADDYIVKPFDPIELKARVQARLNKTQKRKEKENILTKDDMTLNASLQKVTWKQSNKEMSIDLTPLEFKLLYHFVKHEDHVFSRNQLIDVIWGNGVHILDRTIDTHISNLRKKLKDTAYSVQSVHGVGYRFAKQGKNKTQKNTSKYQGSNVISMDSKKIA